MDFSDFESMKNVDVRTIDIGSLKRIEEINLDRGLSIEERWADFMKKIKNPFCYLCNGMVVKVSYCDTGESLESKLIQLCMAMDEI